MIDTRAVELCDCRTSYEIEVLDEDIARAYASGEQLGADRLHHGGRSAKEEQPGRELIPDYFFNVGHAESSVHLTFVQYVFISGQPGLLHVAERT